MLKKNSYSVSRIKLVIAVLAVIGLALAYIGVAAQPEQHTVISSFDPDSEGTANGSFSVKTRGGTIRLEEGGTIELSRGDVVKLVFHDVESLYAYVVKSYRSYVLVIDQPYTGQYEYYGPVDVYVNGELRASNAYINAEIYFKKLSDFTSSLRIEINDFDQATITVDDQDYTANNYAIFYNVKPAPSTVSRLAGGAYMVIDLVGNREDDLDVKGQVAGVEFGTNSGYEVIGVPELELPGLIIGLALVLLLGYRRLAALARTRSNGGSYMRAPVA